MMSQMMISFALGFALLGSPVVGRAQSTTPDAIDPRPFIASWGCDNARFIFVEDSVRKAVIPADVRAQLTALADSMSAVDNNQLGDEFHRLYVAYQSLWDMTEIKYPVPRFRPAPGWDVCRVLYYVGVGLPPDRVDLVTTTAGTSATWWYHDKYDDKKAHAVTLVRVGQRWIVESVVW